jgi:hypothetical protein
MRELFYKHVQVIRSDIEPGSIEKSRDVENDGIRKNLKEEPFCHIFKYRHCFWRMYMEL